MHIPVYILHHEAAGILAAVEVSHYASMHRNYMEAEHMLMEQQLQETAGELQEAERVLDIRKLGHQASMQRRKSLVKTVVADIAEHGPEAPAVMRPGSAPLSKDNPSGSVVMPSGGLVSFDSIRRDFGSMMQVGTY